MKRRLQATARHRSKWHLSEGGLPLGVLAAGAWRRRGIRRSDDTDNGDVFRVRENLDFVFKFGVDQQMLFFTSSARLFAGRYTVRSFWWIPHCSAMFHCSLYSGSARELEMFGLN